MTQGDQKGMNQTLSRKDSASGQRSAKKSLFYQLGYVALTNVCLIKDGDDDPGDHTIIVFRLFSAHSRVQRYELVCNSNLCVKA